jgi:hypothetical protein
MKYDEWLSLKTGTVLIVEDTGMFLVEVKINKNKTLIFQDLDYIEGLNDATGSFGIVTQEHWKERHQNCVSVAPQWVQDLVWGEEQKGKAKSKSSGGKKNGK